MRRLLTLLLAGSLLGLTAYAQYPPRGDGGYYRNPGSLFDHVRADLDRAEGAAYPYGGDRHRFDKVRRELNNFQRSGSRHALDEAIGALQKLVNKNRLSYQDRDILAQDLNQMRDFRWRL